MALGQHEEALQSIDRSLALRPGDADALLNRGNVLEQLRRYEEALASYDQALALRADFAEAALNRGIALRYLSRHEEALTSYDRALALRPDYADAWNARGASLWDLRRLDAALASYDKALALNRDFASAHFNEGCIRLLTGDFTRGWEQYEWRWRDPKLAFPQRDFAEPRWTGTESLQGKTILLHAEQGMGDTLQFCRYVPLVAARGAAIVLEVQPALQALLAQLPGVIQVIAQGEPRPAFDYQCPLLSLPLAFGTGLASIPAPPAYLFADEQRIRLWRSRLGETALPRVGLAWSGSTWHRNDQHRSISLRAFQRLCVPGIDFVSLQKEVRPADQPLLDALPEVRTFSTELTDFTETAALLACLDLIICVDTAVLHLAGALGRPAWLLLPFTPDWRWLLDRDDSPWYPTVRLFRQPKAGDWDSVLVRAGDELSSWAKTRQHREA
jgi:tetratricopeptide (TPR) repeat protein